MYDVQPPIHLSRTLAQKIIDTTHNTIPYNINIMDPQGIIIASRSPARIDTFHEIAYRIITGPEEMIETKDTSNLIGTHSGINIAIRHQNQKIGVLGITGAPDEVRPFILILKLAIETMLKYELEQQSYVLKYSQQQHLEAGFIYGTSTDKNLVKWANELNLDTSIYRIPIMIRTERPLSFTEKNTMTALLTSAPNSTCQDFYTQWPRKEFTIFKAASDDPVQNYRTAIEEFLEPFRANLEARDIRVYICTGSFCNQLEHYYDSYKRAHWLMDTIVAGNLTGIEFFYDHVNEWMNSFIPTTEYRDIFNFFVQDSISDEFIHRMLSARKALTKNNFNFVNASQQLFIHKNTLFCWINEVRKRFNIDPVQNLNDRSFWSYLCDYLQNR